MTDRHVQPENEVSLSGRIAGALSTRTSPAGIPITRFPLEHESKQTEAGVVRKVRCRITVVASGKALQPQIQQLDEGMQVRVQGFLSYESSRQTESRLVLHIQNIDVIEY